MGGGCVAAEALGGRERWERVGEGLGELPPV